MCAHDGVVVGEGGGEAGGIVVVCLADAGGGRACWE